MQRVRAVCEWCNLLRMLHSTLLCCTAALAAAKSRGGPSWTAARREHFAANGYVLQPDVIRPEDRDALVAAFERLFKGAISVWKSNFRRPHARRR